MYQVIKRVPVNVKEQIRVLTVSGDFVVERFIGDDESLTGPHRAKTWKTRRGAERNALRFTGTEVR